MSVCLGQTEEAAGMGMVSVKRWKISDKLELVRHLGDISHGNCEKETAGEKKCSCSLGKGSGLNE